MATKWEDKFSVGVSEIDAQHKRLFSLVDNIEQLSTKHKGELIKNFKEIVKVIDELGDYSVTHFYSEEMAMDECKCPEAEDHKKKHEVFVDEINNIRENLTENKLFQTDESKLEELVNRLYTFLTKWLTSHILVVDMKYKGKIREL